VHVKDHAMGMPQAGCSSGHRRTSIASMDHIIALSPAGDGPGVQRKEQMWPPEAQRLQGE